MKKITIIISLLFFLTAIAQKQKATLFLRDGTELKGLAKISAYGNNIKFRKEKGATRTNYTSKDLEYLIIREKVNAHLGNIRGDIKNTIYYYRKVQGSKSYKLLELLEKGKVSLYKKISEGSFMTQNGVNGTMMMNSNSISDYYVAKNDEETVTHLGTIGSPFSKNFKKAASEYFMDCLELVNKIQNKEFKKRNIVDIVEFYNENCN